MLSTGYRELSVTHVGYDKEKAGEQGNHYVLIQQVENRKKIKYSKYYKYYPYSTGQLPFIYNEISEKIKILLARVDIHDFHVLKGGGGVGNYDNYNKKKHETYHDPRQKLKTFFDALPRRLT